MKRIGLTQRVEILADREERRDCLDQNWARLLTELGFLPIILSNVVEDVNAYLQAMNLDGAIITGGNDLELIKGAEGVAVERDRFEHTLLDFCALNRLPLLGVCRGLQAITVHYGGKISTFAGHVACRHPVSLEEGAFGCWPGSMEVNSYHNHGVKESGLNSKLRPLGRAGDSTIEALKHVDFHQYGIMWHPERERPFSKTDLTMLFNLFGDHVK